MNDRLRKENNTELRDLIRVIDRSDPDYPEILRHYPRMPQRIYVLGNLPDPEKKSVAIVGARGCSVYGKEEAIRFGEELARADVQVISGLAFGIDAWAAHGALQAGGKTFAVVGTGVDICYPKENYALYRRIIREGGGIISEFEPGDGAPAWHFPIRNRIISALADLVLVVEAKKKSGSLITAGYALEQGKSIFAIPGRNSDPLSEGCNRLIAEGAGIAYGPETILEELGIETVQANAKREHRGGSSRGESVPLYAEDTSTGERPDRRTAKPRTMDRNVDPTSMGAETGSGERRQAKKWEHSDDFQKIWKAMETDGGNLNTLLDRTGLSLPALSSVLTQLCISGYAEEVMPGYFKKKR